MDKIPVYLWGAVVSMGDSDGETLELDQCYNPFDEQDMPNAGPTRDDFPNGCRISTCSSLVEDSSSTHTTNTPTYTPFISIAVMSWIGELAGGAPPPRFVDNNNENKVPDPNIPNRMVSNKSANRPFLAYKEYRDEQQALHAAWLEKKKIRDEKIAKGEKVGPLERDPTEATEIGVLGLLKFFVILLVCLALAGKFFTGSYTWENRSKWLQLKTYMPTDQRLFSENLLSEYNGEPAGPLYLAIDGDVYDVSKGKAYQKGGSYHHFVGLDAARAFATGCFKEHRTHDIRGLSEDEQRSLAHWKKFYAEHKDYAKVGRVNHRPIDPNSPIPVHCDPKKAQKAKEREEEARKTRDKQAQRANHEEL